MRDWGCFRECAVELLSVQSCPAEPVFGDGWIVAGVGSELLSVQSCPAEPVFAYFSGSVALPIWVVNGWSAATTTLV